MAEAIDFEVGYLNEGEYRWIIGAKDSRVAWVSDDFYIYRSSAALFDLDPERLSRLSSLESLMASIGGYE